MKTKRYELIFLKEYISLYNLSDEDIVKIFKLDIDLIKRAINGEVLLSEDNMDVLLSELNYDSFISFQKDILQKIKIMKKN